MQSPSAGASSNTIEAFTFTIIGILGGMVVLVPPWLRADPVGLTGYSNTFDSWSVSCWPFLALFVLFLLKCLLTAMALAAAARMALGKRGLPIFAMTIWLIASAAFSLYVSNFATYDRVYGSLGAVIILLLALSSRSLHDPDD